ncbi:MAG: SOS response-associated peptidase [Pseudolabrys sp.]|nr:SOS response-associated peptidase [Pseudolabrys sp.]
MCSRYTLVSAPAVIRNRFGYCEQPVFPPRYNIAPSQPIAVVRISEGRRRFALMRWGLIPSWARDPRALSLLYNARGETVLTKPAFRAAMKRRRCLIPADGFYEWQAGRGSRQPYYVRARSGALMAFAGLWDSWVGPNGEELDGAAIITTASNRTLTHVHARMPAILPPEAFEPWLDCAAVDAASAWSLLAPAPEDLLEAYAISTAVNRVTNDDASLLRPVGEHDAPRSSAKATRGKSGSIVAEPDDGQQDLF